MFWAVTIHKLHSSAHFTNMNFTDTKVVKWLDLFPTCERLKVMENGDPMPILDSPDGCATPYVYEEELAGWPESEGIFCDQEGPSLGLAPLRNRAD